MIDHYAQPYEVTMTLWDDLQQKFEMDLDELEEDRKQRSISYQEARQISETAHRVFNQLRLTDRDDPGMDWFDEYLKLFEVGFPWRVACYIAWASSKKIGRKPKFLKDLATDILGLNSPRVIHMWRKNYKAIDAFVTSMQIKPFEEHRRDVIDATINSGINEGYKGFNDRKMMLEILGIYKPSNVLKLGEAGKDDMHKLSEDVLREMGGEISSQFSLKDVDEEKIDE